MTEMQPVLITTQVVSFIPKCGKVYSKQTHVIIFVSDLRQVSGFLKVLQIIPHQKTEILCESGVKHHKP
jgi:hypothetical protein